MSPKYKREGEARLERPTNFAVRSPFRDLPSTEYVPPLGTGDVPSLSPEVVSEMVAKALEVTPDDVKRAHEVLSEFRSGIRTVPTAALAELSSLLENLGSSPVLDQESRKDTLQKAAQDLTKALVETGWKGQSSSSAREHTNAPEPGM